MDMTSEQAATPIHADTALVLVVTDAVDLAAVLTAIYADGSEARIYSREATPEVGEPVTSVADGYTVAIVGTAWTVRKTSDGGWPQSPTLSLTVVPESGIPETVSIAFALGPAPKMDGPINWQDVVNIAPELATVPVLAQNAILIDAIATLNPLVWKSKLPRGLKYLCAHVATLGHGLAGRGPVTSETVGPMSRSYAAELGSDTWGRTSYGAQLRVLKRSLALIGGVA